jgi:hypothetical protein
MEELASNKARRFTCPAGFHRLAARFQRSDAAMSAIDLKRTSGSSFEGMKPRRPQNAAASASTALTISACPPMRPAALTQRCSACLSRPVPRALAGPVLNPLQAVPVAGRGQGRVPDRSVWNATGVMARSLSAQGHNSRPPDSPREPRSPP